MKHCLERMANVPDVKAEVVYEWPGDKAVRDAAAAVVVVRFAIGFETELEAQTAVWVEDTRSLFFCPPAASSAPVARSTLWPSRTAPNGTSEAMLTASTPGTVRRRLRSPRCAAALCSEE